METCGLFYRQWRGRKRATRPWSVTMVSCSFWAPRGCLSTHCATGERFVVTQSRAIFLCTRDRRLGCILFLSCQLSFYHSKILSETFTLQITFKQWVLELRYFTWVFLLTRLFCGSQHFLFYPWPWSLTFFGYTLTMLITWMVSARAFIFHMSISSDNTFPWIPTFLILWPWPYSLAYFLKTLILTVTSQQWVLELWYFTLCSLWHDFSVDTNIFLPMTMTFEFGLLFENLTFLITFQQQVLEFSYFTKIFLVISSFCFY